MGKVTDKKVWEALDAFEAEIKSWSVVRDQSSEYNDKGVLKYSHYFVSRDRMPVLDYESRAVAVNETFERHRLKDGTAQTYVRWRGLKAALEAAQTSQ